MTTRYHFRVRNLSERSARLIHDQYSLPISFFTPLALGYIPHSPPHLAHNPPLISLEILSAEMPRWPRVSLSAALFLAALSVQPSQAGNTTCVSRQLDWYTSVVGESPCK